MLEWLITVGATELGKVMFEQVLKLGQSAAEDYVKDFFKGCLREGITATKPAVAKKAVVEALQAFLLLVEDELLDQGISEVEIRDRYEQPLLQFVQNNAVKPVLGKAFEKDCRAIAIETLIATWQAPSFKKQPFPPMPEDFDWRRIGGEYVKKVRRIVRESTELRSLLETDLLEDIARNTAQLSPGFDVEKYRASLQSSYGYLKLCTLDSTDRVDAIKLWSMFIEQTVREALPPMRYDLPLDLKRQLHAKGHLEADLSPDALEHYRHEYFQQPARKVLEAIGQAGSSLALLKKEGTGSQSLPFQGGLRGIEAHAQRAVILGDPGSGKSSLLQYLALEWVEGKTEKMPLLIELREFAINPSANFLDFLHRGRGVDWQFDQHQLHQHLLEFPTLVMFDGLDEVFDRATQSTVIDDIIRFSQQYPNAQILVTSRIIGYNPDRLQHSGFRHFTIQSLDTAEIHEFIDRWYDLSMGSDPDKVRLKQRLKDAIANSKAIANLADNPLLLTMMAILNRQQELPRDRTDLYEQASRVLLYQWDVDHKRLQIPMDAIGRREKQEMLRAIAYEMQAGEEGLKGNLISAERLTRILTDYLRDQGFSEPREKANRLIQQLRERNFILCYRGADTYSFMHRTFLEYFCAVEIVHRFEKQRTLTFDQLRDEVFGQHWQDETWHEVLRLICGAIEPKFAGELIKYLFCISKDTVDWEIEDITIDLDYGNLLLAADCLLEVRERATISEISNQLLILIQQELETEDWEDTLHLGRKPEALVDRIGKLWRHDSQVIHWLRELVIQSKNSSEVLVKAIQVVAQSPAKLNTDNFLRNIVFDAMDESIRWEAMSGLIKRKQFNHDSLNFCKELIDSKNRADLREFGVQVIRCFWQNEPDTYDLIKNLVERDEDSGVRLTALTELLHFYEKPSDFVGFLHRVIKSDDNYFVLDVALEALLIHYPTHPKTLELLRDRALNDPDEQLRQWAQEQLEKLKMQDKKLEMEGK